MLVCTPHFSADQMAFLESASSMVRLAVRPSRAYAIFVSLCGHKIRACRLSTLMKMLSCLPYCLSAPMMIETFGVSGVGYKLFVPLRT